MRLLPPSPVRALALLFACLSIPSGEAAAHSLSRSYSRWDVEGREVRIAVDLPLLELARMRSVVGGRTARELAADPEAGAWIAALTEQQVRLVDDGARCVRAGGVRVAPLRPTRLEVAWRLRCAREPAPSAAVDLFFGTAPSHVHHLTLRAGGARHEALLTAHRRAVDFGGTPAGVAPEVAPGLLGAIVLGAEHVASGLDHVAFVIALLLPGGRLLHLLGVSAGFTVGHSVTLALAALGLVGVTGAAVEVLVGLSIAYAALCCFQAFAAAAPPGRRGRRRGLLGSGRSRRSLLGVNLGIHAVLLALALTVGSTLPWPAVLGSALATTSHLLLHGADAGRAGSDATRTRAALALLFGLVHGFAFAGALGDIFQGGDLVALLLGFNVGVELAQACVLVATASLFALVTRLAGVSNGQRLRVVIAACVLAFGLSLTLTRALGG